MDTIFNDKIQHLRPLEAPARVVFEPVTIGWYLLACLLVILLCWLLVVSIRRYRRNKYRRDAMRIVREEYKAYLKGNKTLQQYVVCSATEMKRTAIVSFGREYVAGLSGAKWVEFVSKTHRRTHFTANDIEIMNRVPFDSTHRVEASNVKHFHRMVMKWIGGHHA